MNQEGKNNSFYGRRHTEESKRKMSDALKGRTPWNKGKKCPNTSKTLMGHMLSQETKDKISTTLKNKYKNGLKSPFCDGHTIRNTGKTRFKKGRESPRKGLSNIVIHGKEKANEISAKIRARRLLQVFPKKDTSIEVSMQQELNRRGIAYETHIPVCGVCQPDMIFPEKKVVIQCDGDYWHNLPEMIEKDRRQDKVLRENGWQVLRFWEHDINNDVSQCVDLIEGVVS